MLTLLVWVLILGVVCGIIYKIPETIIPSVFKMIAYGIIIIIIIVIVANALGIGTGLNLRN